MAKHTPDYDNVFKTLKVKHKRLFISVINDTFGKNYPFNAEVELLPSEGYLTESETKDGSRKIDERISDLLIKIGNELYLLECQSYDDESMAIRIAEYAFITARQYAKHDIGQAVITMPRFAVIYVKRTKRTPKTTKITFIFPNGQTVDYETENVILEEFTKEYIVKKRLFPYIPFYITRYEKDIISKNNIENAINDLEFFRDEMIKLHDEEELSDYEIIDLMELVNTIVTHITNGSQNEERLVKVMGGVVLETESERLIRQGISQGLSQSIKQGEAKMLIEMGQRYGLDVSDILKELQENVGLSLEQATQFWEQYGKQLD